MRVFNIHVFLNGKTRNNFRVNDNRNVIPLRHAELIARIDLMFGMIRGVVLNLGQMIKVRFLVISPTDGEV